MRGLGRTFVRGVLPGLVVAVAMGLTATSAHAAFGDQLAAFNVSIYEGRGIAVTGSTALLSKESSTTLDRANLATHSPAGELATVGGPADGFGALAIDASGNLWAAEYGQTTGWIDRIDGEAGVHKVFNAAELNAEDTAIDGLAVGPDGTLWISGEGLQPGPTKVDHFEIDQATEAVKEAGGGGFTVPYGNSGIAVDGEGHVWLAEIENSGGGWGTTIHEYTEAGVEMRSFPLGTASGEAIHPEGIGIDHCTFPGKLALWVFGANGTTSPLAAYEIGTTTDTSGCPPPPSPEGSNSGSGSGSSPTLRAGGAGGPVVAGSPTLLQASDPADPNGTLFTYLWSFGDGHHLRGHGRVRHTYRCAGLYRVKVTEIDSFGARHVSTGRLAVGFPRNTRKRYRGLRFAPKVHLFDHRAKLWLSWSGRGRGVRARSIDWKLDRRRGNGYPIHTRVVSRVKRGRNHRLRARVHFSDGHTTTIRACFHT